MKKEIDEPLMAGGDKFDITVDELKFIMDKNNVTDKDEG